MVKRKSDSTLQAELHKFYKFLQKIYINNVTKKTLGTDYAGEVVAIGSSLLQFVKEFDLEITATCKPEMNETILNLGADKTIAYTAVDFKDSNEKYDFVFDSVGKTTFGKSENVVTKKGIYIS